MESTQKLLGQNHRPRPAGSSIPLGGPWRPAWLMALALLHVAPAVPAYAQVFKWVGPDGKTNYSDVAPPPALHAQKKNFPGNIVGTGELPAALAEANRNNPVVLYTGAKCQPCDDGRKLLVARGIPFVEKTVTSNADIALLGDGKVELPQLQVGTYRQRGFEAATWQARLTTAGYPVSSMLPATYRTPPPEAAAASAGDATADGSAAGAPPRARAQKPLPLPHAGAAAKGNGTTPQDLRF